MILPPSPLLYHQAKETAALLQSIMRPPNLHKQQGDPKTSWASQLLFLTPLITLTDFHRDSVLEAERKREFREKERERE